LPLFTTIRMSSLASPESEDKQDKQDNQAVATPSIPQKFSVPCF